MNRTFSAGISTAGISVAGILSVVTILLPATIEAKGSDWNRFRGPNGLGTIESTESALPSHFGPTENVVWKSALPPGSSSPVISGQRLFLTAFEGDELLTLCLDSETGKELWRRTAPRDRNEELDSRNDAASPSPVTDGEQVSVFFGDYGLVTYDLDGKELWRRPLGPFNNLYGMGASPILAGELLVLALDQHTDSSLIALDRKTGEQVWRSERPEAKTGHSTPMLYTPEGGIPQIILPGSFFLTSYSVSTGEKLWWIRGLSFEMKSVPATSNGLLFINGYGSQFNDPDQNVALGDFASVLESDDKNKNGLLDEGEPSAKLVKEWFPFNDLNRDKTMDLEEWTYFRESLASRNNIMAVRLPARGERGDLTSSHVQWQYFRSIPQLPSPLVYRDVLYMINDRGIVTTFQPETGEVLHQGRIAGAVDSYYASPIAADGKIYFAGRSGKIAVLPPGGDLEPIVVNDLEDTITATPAVANGRLYVRTQGWLYAFALPH